MKLNEIKKLNESSGKNLLGLTIDGKEITEKTSDEVWDSRFDCSSKNLESLKGCPKEVHGYFSCRDNKLESLEYSPQIVHGSFDCAWNKLESLKDINRYLKEMNGTFWAHNNPIKSHVLGLLLVKGCKEVILNNDEIQNILNKYLPNTSGMKSVFECQEELLFAGFEEFAQL